MSGSQRTVWKFPLDRYLYDRQGMVTDRPTVPLPQGARILCVQMQDNRPTVWALVEPGQPVEARQLFIVGTGHPVPEQAVTYLGTWQSSGFVFHLFEGDARRTRAERKDQR